MFRSAVFILAGSFVSLSLGAHASDAGAPGVMQDAKLQSGTVGSRAVRLSDEELDRIVAGRATIVETGSNTWILNPGRASVGIVHNNGRFTCINLCGLPPPPPPPGSGN